jgi:hypothetical protein
MAVAKDKQRLADVWLFRPGYPACIGRVLGGEASVRIAKDMNAVDLKVNGGVCGGHRARDVWNRGMAPDRAYESQ